jgi:hypothetical protein
MWNTVLKNLAICSEGQETGTIAPAPENARKKIEGHGRSRP